MSSEDQALEQLLRSALAEDAARAIPGPSSEVRRRVRAGMERRRRRPGRRLVLALVAVAAALALATGVAVATGVVNQRIVEVPRDVWLQHFAQQHHGTTGKGSAQPLQPASVAEAQRRAGCHVHTLNGLQGAELTSSYSTTVVFRDGSVEPEVELEYRVGDVRVIIVEVRDPNPGTPLEVPGVLRPPSHIETIGGSQYLFGEASNGQVFYVQFKTTDGIVFSVNFYGPPSASAGGPGPVDHDLAANVVRHIG